MNPSPSLPIVVIGAGVAGLACATKLAALGAKVTLVESTSHGGGRARSFHDAQLGREIDNGQHLFMGCYVHTQRLLRRIQRQDDLWFQKDLEVNLLRPEARSPLALRCPTLPAPMHVAAGLLRMRGLGLQDRLSVLRLGVALHHELARPDDHESCDAWLSRMGQSPGLRRLFWDPLVWGTLNEDPLACSAAMLMAVVKRGFASTQRASRFGVSKIGLSRLYVDPSLAYLRSRNAKVYMGTPVKEISSAPSGRCVVHLKDGTTLLAAALVSTVPPHALSKILDPRWAKSPALRDLDKLGHSPIVNLWARLDRPILKGQHFVGLIDSPLHWVFDRDRLESQAPPESANHLVSVTISGARSQVQDSAQTLQSTLQSELARFYPKNPPKILAFRAIKEHRATIRHAVGSYLQRPLCDSQIPGLFLAGDWVRTGLPATIESAAQSGHEAAMQVMRYTASA